MPAGNSNLTQTSNFREVRIATFNVRGLRSASKLDQLARDLARYRIDFCGLQETKLAEASDKFISKDYRLVSFGQTAGEHGGIGFAVSRRFNQFISKYKKLSDRVGYVDLSLPQCKNTALPVRIVIAYGPTNPSAQINPDERDKFYDLLSRAWLTASKRTLVIAVGDFNSKVGNAPASCVGQYGRGTRNENGQQLVEWANANRLLLANTLFRYSMRFRTTWTGCFLDRTSGQKKPIYNMIDYIIIPEKFRPLVKRARSYGGTETFSDHKLVIADMEFDHLYKSHRTPPKNRPAPLAVQSLADGSTREHYQSQLEDNLAKMATPESPVETWSNAVSIILKTADTAVGRMHRAKNGRLKLPNGEVGALSEQQRKIRLLAQSGHPDQHGLQKERNRIMHEIRVIQRREANARLDRYAELVETAPTTAQMFTAASLLKSGRKKQQIIVESADGHVLLCEEDKAARVKDHFQQAFGSEKAATIPKPAPYEPVKPITAEEVMKAAQRLRNSKACGPDDVNGELLKYANSALYEIIASLVNSSISYC